MAIMEAMSCQLPVIATDVGGNSEIIEHGKTGMLVERANPNSVADALTTLIKEKRLREKMGLNGRERILESFSLEKMTKEYENLYSSALGI